MGLAIPSITRLMKHLRASGMDVPEDVFTVAKAKEAVLKALRRRDSDA
jgi:energy-coupling factor transport system ATP-binding protein